MKTCFKSLCLVIFVMLGSPIAGASVYLELSPSLAEIDTPARSTRPLLADFRLGYERPGQQFEVALMLGINDDSLHQLNVEVPSVLSVFFHYLPEVESRIKLHLIVGYSHLEVESSYTGMTKVTDRFDGISYGFGVEEAFRSNPQMKISFDWIRLYHGDRLNINAASLGFHYDF